MRQVLTWVFPLLLVLASACHRQTQTRDGAGSAVDVDAEIAQIKQELKTSPNSSDLHEQLSVLAAVKKDWPTFEEENALAIRLDPNKVTNYCEGAEVYLGRGLTDKALAMMKSAIAADPENPLSRFILGNMYERIHDREKAKMEYEETRRLMDVLKAPERREQNRIEGEKYYDRFGNTYMLNIVSAKLKGRLQELQMQKP